MSCILIIIEIDLAIDPSGIEIYQVDVNGVYVKVEFWSYFQTSYPFIVIPVEYNYFFYIMLY